jgi:hypothetical protein
MSTFTTAVVTAAVTAALTLAITQGVPLLWKAYKNRYVEPKEAHRQLLLDQANWYNDRAEKLAAFRFQLGRDGAPDRFKLAEYVSRLDPMDREWAMKQTDIGLLRKLAEQKGAECQDNGSDAARWADNIVTKVLF